jgi:hypothetical protein
MRCASGLRLQWFVLTVILARDTEPAKRCGSFGAPPHVIRKLRTGHVLPVPHRARVGEVPLLLSKTKRSDHDIPDQEQPNCGRHRWLATAASQTVRAKPQRPGLYGMLQTVSKIELALKNSPELLVLNKFGKAEAEGMGMRDLIAQAICMGVPVIVGIPERNLCAWREFAGEFSVELNGSGGVDEWLRRRSTKEV